MFLGILLKNKKLIAVFLVVIVVAILAWRLWPSSKLPQADVPSDNANAEPTPEEHNAANEMARALYADMDGFSINHDTDLYRDFAQMSDKLFVLTYNRFNALYEEQDNGTLREYMKVDWFGSTIWETISNIIFPRMDRLNLL